MWYLLLDYIYSLLIEKGICDHQNLSFKLCVCVCLSSRDHSSYVFVCVFPPEIIQVMCLCVPFLQRSFKLCVCVCLSSRDHSSYVFVCDFHPEIIQVMCLCVTFIRRSFSYVFVCAFPPEIIQVMCLCVPFIRRSFKLCVYVCISSGISIFT